MCSADSKHKKWEGLGLQKLHLAPPILNCCKEKEWKVEMAVLIDGGIITVIVLVSTLVVLVLVFVLTSVVVVRKKRLLCFRRNEYTRPFLLTDRDLEKRRGRLGRDSRVPYSRRAPKKRRKNRPNQKNEGYQSFSKALKFPKRDPFAKSFLENPMIDSDELNMDWTNPAFDAARAQKFDAVLTIQSWYRMLR